MPSITGAELLNFNMIARHSPGLTSYHCDLQIGHDRNAHTRLSLEQAQHHIRHLSRGEDRSESQLL